MKSMTGYASRGGNCVLNLTRIDWEWDMRAVNGRGLEIRMRLPEGYGFIEKKLKDRISGRVARGSVTLGLRLRVAQPDAAAQVDHAALKSLLEALRKIDDAAQAGGVVLQAPTALDVLGWRGIQPSSHDLGRKLEFLTQEFNREANTLCAKAQHLEMTRIGLDLKAVIDQMREQVQNVE